MARIPMRIVDANPIAPDRPGHGIEIDWKRLAKLAA